MSLIFTHHDDGVEKSKDDIDEEGRLLEELLDVVEQRNVLVAMLEDERLR